MRNFMNYKGYTGSVEYSDEDHCLFGKVMGIRSLILYEGSSVDELKNDFQSAIDDYLNGCLEAGVEPEKPYKGSFNVRISPELHRQAAAVAAAHKMSLNSFVESSIEKAVRIG